MAKMRAVAPDELGALPIQIHERVELRCTPAELFASFTRDADWKQWLNITVERTSAGDYREGFTRRVRSGPLALDEVFTVWAPGERMAFYMEYGNLPLFRAFAEDWCVSPREGGCTLDWRVGIEARVLGRLALPALRRNLLQGARDGFPKLEALATGTPG